jgi:hypothetical protein
MGKTSLNYPVYVNRSFAYIRFYLTYLQTCAVGKVLCYRTMEISYLAAIPCFKFKSRVVATCRISNNLRRNLPILHTVSFLVCTPF